MDIPSFTVWLRRRDGQPAELVPQVDRLLPLVAQAGSRGLTRKEIGAAIDLEPDVLDDLLDGLTRAGTFTVRVIDGVRVYLVTAVGGWLAKLW